MDKFIDDPAVIVDDMLAGLGLVLDRYVDIEGRMVVRKGLRDEPSKVTSVTLGGAGHEPSSLGFIGRGWECVKVLGDIFAAPSAIAVADAIRLADKGKGVLLYVGNHDGDVMSAKLALKLLKREPIRVEMVCLRDDISTFGRDRLEERRGMAGSLALGRIIGAACEAGYSLSEVRRVAETYLSQVATLSVATSGATHPVNGQAISKISPHKMVIGMGQHGEGRAVEEPMCTAKEIAQRIAKRLIQDLNLCAGDRVSLTLNGTGATTYMELMILYRDTASFLNELGIEIAAKIVGEYLTTQEQAGFQMSIAKLDGELCSLMRSPCHTAFVNQD